MYTPSEATYNKMVTNLYIRNHHVKTFSPEAEQLIRKYHQDYANNEEAIPDNNEAQQILLASALRKATNVEAIKCYQQNQEQRDCRAHDIEKLIGYIQNIHASDPETGDTAFHLAAKSNDTLAYLILSKFISMQPLNKEGKPPFAYWTVLNDPDIDRYEVENYKQYATQHGSFSSLSSSMRNFIKAQRMSYALLMAPKFSEPEHDALSLQQQLRILAMRRNSYDPRFVTNLSSKVKKEGSVHSQEPSSCTIS